MKEFHLEIVTPDGMAFEGMVESLLVHTDEGDVEFLAGHIEYLTALGIGRARIRHQGKDRLAAVSGGFVTIANGQAKMVATTFEFAEDIDLTRAKLAKEKANAVLSSSKDKQSIELAKVKLQRAISRIRIAEIK